MHRMPGKLRRGSYGWLQMHGERHRGIKERGQLDKKRRAQTNFVPYRAAVGGVLNVYLEGSWTSGTLVARVKPYARSFLGSTGLKPLVLVVDDCAIGPALYTSLASRYYRASRHKYCVRASPHSFTGHQPQPSCSACSRKRVKNIYRPASSAWSFPLMLQCVGSHRKMSSHGCDDVPVEFLMRVVHGVRGAHWVVQALKGCLEIIESCPLLRWFLIIEMKFSEECSKFCTHRCGQTCCFGMMTALPELFSSYRTICEDILPDSVYGNVLKVKMLRCIIFGDKEKRRVGLFQFEQGHNLSDIKYGRSLYRSIAKYFWAFS